MVEGTMGVEVVATALRTTAAAAVDGFEVA